MIILQLIMTIFAHLSTGALALMVLYICYLNLKSEGELMMNKFLWIFLLSSILYLIFYAKYILKIV